MYRGHVIGLVEFVEHHLPVAGQGSGQGEITFPFFDLVTRPVIPDRPEVFLERYTVRIHVDPDETGKRLTAQFNQIHLVARIALRKILRILGVNEFPIRQKGPAVVTAYESVDMTFGSGDELVTAVLADVVERPYAAVGLANHQDRFRSHIFALPVTRIGNLGAATEQEPDFGPHVLPFECEKFP